MGVDRNLTYRCLNWGREGRCVAASDHHQPSGIDPDATETDPESGNRIYFCRFGERDHKGQQSCSDYIKPDISSRGDI